MHRSCAWIVAALWYFVEIVVMEAFSLAAAGMARFEDAALPASLMRACRSWQLRLAGDEGDERSVSLLFEVALMTSNALNENANEPRDSHTTNSQSVSPGEPHFEEHSQQWLDEGSMALIDTACTACMHSKSWREHYQQTLPDGSECSPTPYRKVFHFANGSSTEDQIPVWRIPIFLKGYRGEVFSAEVPSGHTPLLLSISSMAALDMVIHVKEQKVFVKSLGIEMTLFTTRTRHLAIWISYGPEIGIYDALGAGGEQPKIISEREDLMVYYQEEGGFQVLGGLAFREPEEIREKKVTEKPRLDEGGVKTADKRSEVSKRREAELSESASHVLQQDKRMWLALKREYTLAEQWATKGFRCTVVFEPFAGSFQLTQTASGAFGWTNSQPMDLLDGYDLLTPHGERLVFNTLEEHDPYLTVLAFDCRIWTLMTNMNQGVDWQRLRETVGRLTLRRVKKICLHRAQRGRFYLVENPAGSAAWVFDGLLKSLLEYGDGKYVVADQCAYGLRDRDSGRPIKKPTGFLSNCEHILNRLGRRCVCKWGAHQQLLGGNSGGARSRQAAAYPRPLCLAICKGILDSMRSEYAISMTWNEEAFPVHEEMGTDVEMFSDKEPGVPAEDEMGTEAMDEWVLEEGYLSRYHRMPRKRLFRPTGYMEMPVDIDQLSSRRITKKLSKDGNIRVIEDDWHKKAADPEEDPEEWTGETIFPLKTEAEMEATRRKEEEGQPEAVEEVKKDKTLLRRRARTRQLQRGFWSEVKDEETVSLMLRSLEDYEETGATDWQAMDVAATLGSEWLALESAKADVSLILVSATARRMRKPQPYFGPLEAPLRKTLLLLSDEKVLSTDWEEWGRMAPSSQIRPLVAQGRRLCVTLFGKFVGEDHQPDRVDPDRFRAEEQAREARWQNLPRELKLAIKRIHVNLGHASVPAMLKALRISRASETAIKAVRLFRCEDCPRLQEPKLPRPSKLPVAEDFNVQLGLDVLEVKDADNKSWSFLNILCQGTTYQICTLLGETHKNPTGRQVVEAFTSGWLQWAGFPERGVMTDRAKPFLRDVAQEVADHGCFFETAAKAAPWQIGAVERHGGIWKSMFKKVAYAEQVHTKEGVLLAAAACNQAKNSLSRKHGFAPTQLVLGKDIRLPADLVDEQEVHRIGAQALAENPESRFYKKHQLRMKAREAFIQSSNSEAIRRAELRQVRPWRGPFHPGMYVFYWDSASAKIPGPACWRGVARVIGKEGSHTVWISHRGLLLAVSPEHLARAFDEEVRQWAVVGQESELIDATPAAGGTGFIDLRGAPKPPDDWPKEDGAEDEEEERLRQDGEDVPEEGRDEEERGREEVEREGVGGEDLSSSSTSMRRIEMESRREMKREMKSYDFFERRERERKRLKGQTEADSSRPSAAEVPVPADMEIEFDPERHDYHQAKPARGLDPIAEGPEMEAQEREAKRLRVGEAEDASLQASDVPFAFMATEVPSFLKDTSRRYFRKHEEAFLAAGVSEDVFLFGMKRNSFQERYEALAAQTSGGATKKKGRKEIRLNDLSEEQKKLFTQPGGSDQKEWDAWKSKEACDVLDVADSRKLRKEKPDLIVPTRWVRTNKHDGLVGQPFLAKSRLVVQGFKDKSLGHYRRDAPTASAIAESICLSICAFHCFTLIAKDIKNAYFSGKAVGREIYLDQPRGGLPDLRPGQLMKANKAIYGFAEAARLFWLALREHLLSDGWEESKLEPALFYYRRDGKLKGIIVTHVDDIEGGLHDSVFDQAFQKSSRALEFATNHVRDFIIRGREVKQTAQHHVDVSMRNYALSMKLVKIEKTRRQQLDQELTEEEKETLNSLAGELGWIARQLRCDLTYENGVIQRCKSDPVVADLVRLKQYVGMARRSADFKMRYWADVNLKESVIIHLADSGHANGTPEKNEQMRYRSVGGYFILAANPGILEDQEVRCNILAYHSGLTKRVCRSTLAAEASHLAEAVETGDWIIVLLEEALTGRLDLRSWTDIIEKRPRVYVTDARSVFDYLQRDANSTSSDKRMAIEGALLRETVRRENAHVRWIDGMQNVADVLTKSNADKDILKAFLKDGMMSLVQTEANKVLKEKKRGERQRRHQSNREDEEAVRLKQEQKEERKRAAVSDAKKFGEEKEDESG